MLNSTGEIRKQGWRNPKARLVKYTWKSIAPEWQTGGGEVANWRRIKIDCYRQNQWVKKVVIQYVAPWGISGSNEPPMGYVLSKLAVLEGWKEKFPAYRGSVVPTHFQKQVGWGTWLYICYICYICYKLAAISNIQPSFVSILFKTPVKHTNPQSGSALSLSSRKGCKKNQHQRCR